MQNRRLRIVKRGPPPAIGVCERCNAQFKSSLPDPGTDIQAQFDAHKCKLVDSSPRSSSSGKELTLLNRSIGD